VVSLKTLGLLLGCQTSQLADAGRLPLTLKILAFSHSRTVRQAAICKMEALAGPLVAA
jgi:hypothetical protein